MTKSKRPPLAGVRVIESSLLGPAAITTHLADLGADVIKVESPSGDYVRQMTWPIVEGTSLLHLHINRGKRSLTLDLRKPEGVAIYLDLVKQADVVIEAMRPGSLARRGLGYDELCEANPRIVFCNISGYGMTGPYRDMPSHGIAYDTWAGLVNPAYDDEGFCYISEHASMGMHAGPLFGALAVLAGVIRARETGEGCQMEIAQSDAAAYMDWYRIESWKAYERPEDGGHRQQVRRLRERRAPGTAGMKEGVRYQMYETSDDAHVLFMASEQRLLEELLRRASGAPELFEKWPGARSTPTTRATTASCRQELRDIFKTEDRGRVDRVRQREATRPIAPVNTPKTIADDPQFQDRFPWLPASEHGADMLAFPVKLLGESLPTPAHAPEVGEQSDEVLSSVLGYGPEEIARLRKAGALG